jgi:RimJ/RimL family protein N-acetyltransferase
MGLNEAPLLATDRLLLRPFRAEDAASVEALWRDPGVIRHTTMRPATRDEAWARLLRYLGLWPALGFGYWAVTLKESGAHIGDAGLADFRRPIEPPLDGHGEAGWVFHPDYHGRGLAAEAMRAVIGWADERRADLPLCCIISAANDASIRLAAKLGFAAAGTARLGDEDIGLYRRQAMGGGR